MHPKICRKTLRISMNFHEISLYVEMNMDRNSWNIMRRLDQQRSYANIPEI